MQTIRLFCDVARYRSFSRAAAEHGITQPAASQRVGQLERRLGVMLLDRSVRPLALTEAGQEYLRGCLDLLQRHHQLEQRIRGRNGARPAPTPGSAAHGFRGFRGQVVVDAIYSAGIDLLNHLKDSFEREHPGLHVVIDYKSPEEVHEAVRHRRCDLGILSYPRRWRDVCVIPLRDEPMAVVFAPGHALARRARVEASDLDDLPMVTFEPTLPVGRAIGRYLRDNHARPRIVNVFDNIDTIKSALSVTGALSILPRRTVQREVLAGALACVALEPELFRPIGIIHPKSHNGGDSLPGHVRAFVDYMLEHAGPDCDLTAAIQLDPKAEPATTKA